MDVTKVTAANKLNKGTYTMYLHYKTAEGATAISGEITLIVICGPESTVITLPIFGTANVYEYKLIQAENDYPRAEFVAGTSSNT